MASPIPSRQGSFTSPPPASPRRPSGLGAGQNAEQRRARREQFRSFYGLKGGPEGVAEGEAVKAGDPLDIGELAQPCNGDVADSRLARVQRFCISRRFDQEIQFGRIDADRFNTLGWYASSILYTQHS
jgi:hypothetical protein